MMGRCHIFAYVFARIGRGHCAIRQLSTERPAYLEKCRLKSRITRPGLDDWRGRTKKEETETWKDAAPAGRFAIGSTARHYSPTAVIAGGASAKPAPPVW